MNVIPNETEIEPSESVSDLRVLVAYEDLPAGIRAMAILERVDREFVGAGRAVHMMWRFDELSDPYLFRIAVTEALAADVIVISAHEAEKLPQEIRDWIARWLLTKDDRPRTLIAALQPNGVSARNQQHILTYLQKVAHHGKLEFFAAGSKMESAVNQGSLSAEDAQRTEPFVAEYSLQTP